MLKSKDSEALFSPRGSDHTAELITFSLKLFTTLVATVTSFPVVCLHPGVLPSPLSQAAPSLAPASVALRPDPSLSQPCSPLLDRCRSLCPAWSLQPREGASGLAVQATSSKSWWAARCPWEAVDLGYPHRRPPQSGVPAGPSVVRGGDRLSTSKSLREAIKHHARLSTRSLSPPGSCRVFGSRFRLQREDPGRTEVVGCHLCGVDTQAALCCHSQAV